MRLGKRIEGAISFIVPLALFMALCAYLRIAPFGDRAFLYEDMKEQYIDFYAYFKAVLHGKDSFVYSTNAGIGANMLGTWAYYLASPFLVMFAIIPEKSFPIALSLFIGLKIATIGFTTWLFLTKLDAKKTFNLPALICSTAFAFSGWVVANMTNSMWLDAVIMLPILGIGILKAVRDEKHSKLFLAVTVMIMVIVNYYIAAMILMFTVIFALILLLLRALPLKKVLNAAIGAILGIILDIWFLIPVAQSIFGSNKDQSGIVAKAFELYIPKCEPLGKSLTPLMILPKLFSAAYDSLEIMEGLPNIYFGAVLLVPFIMFFLNKKITLKEKMIAVLSLAVLTAFFCSRKLDDIAHFGTEPYGYLYRYSFLFSFACLVFVYRELQNISGSSLVSTVVAMAISLVLLFLAKWTGIRFLDNKTILINLFFIVAGFLLMLLYKTLQTGEKNYCLPLALLAIMLLVDSGYNFKRIYDNSSLAARSVSEYRNRCTEIEGKLLQISEDNAGDYRIESLSRMTPNDSLHFGYNSVTAYNSLQKVENRLLLFRMGFNDNGLYAPYEAGNTRTCDALLGVKYLLTDKADPMEGQEVFSDGIIRNKYVLSKDFISGETVDEVIKLFDDSDSPFDVQEKLFWHFTGTNEKVFVPATTTLIEESDDQSTYTVTANADGEVYFYMDRVNLIQRSLEIYLNDELVSPYGNSSCQRILHLGHYTAGEQFELTIKTDGSPIPAEPVIVTEDVGALGRCVLK